MCLQSSSTDCCPEKIRELLIRSNYIGFRGVEKVFIVSYLRGRVL